MFHFAPRPARRCLAPASHALLAAQALLAAACAPTTPGTPAPRPAPEHPRPVADAPPPELPARPEAVTFSFGPGSGRYLVEAETVVRVGGDSLLPAADTVRVTAAVTLGISAGAGARTVAGTIHDTALDFGQRIRPPGPVPVPRPPASLLFGGEVAPGSVSLTLADDAPAAAPADTPETCTDSAAQAATFLALARETLPSVPQVMQVGSSWRDSVVTTTCRGGVRLEVASYHEYEVVAIERGNGASVAHLRRRTRQHVGGRGVQSRLPVVVSGEGSGESDLWLDLANGRLLANEGRLVTTLVHQAGERRAVVEQTTTTRVRLDH